MEKGKVKGEDEKIIEEKGVMVMKEIIENDGGVKV